MIKKHETLLPPFMGEVPERSVGDGGGAQRQTNAKEAGLWPAPPSPLLKTRGTSPINGGRKA